MSNMLCKTNRSLFVRNYNFQLTKKSDSNHEKNLYRMSTDIEISHFLDAMNLLILVFEGKNYI